MPQDTALHKAAYKGDCTGCEVAVEDDELDVNARGAQNRTALMRACGSNSADVVEYLISKGLFALVACQFKNLIPRKTFCDN